MLANYLKKWGLGIAALALGAVAVVLCLVSFNNKIENVGREELITRVEEVRDNAAYTLENELSHVVQMVVNEARVLDMMGDATDEEIISELHEFVGVGRAVRATILRFDGTTCSSDGEVGKYDKELYSDAIHTTKSYISAPRFSEDNENVAIDVFMPMYSTGKRTGVLVTSYDISLFEQIFIKKIITGESAICITTADGDLIFRTGTVEAPDGFDKNVFDFYVRDDVEFLHGSPESLRADMLAGRASSLSYENGGMVRFVSYASAGDWYVASVTTDRSLTIREAHILSSALDFAMQVVVAVLIITGCILVSGIKEQRRHVKELSDMAYVDSLTGLANKKKFKITALELLKKKPGAYALILLDINEFKVLNDTLGYECGDRVLRMIADVISESLGAGEAFGRGDADEYYLLVKYQSDSLVRERIIEGIDQINERFRATVNDAYTIVLCAGVYVVRNTDTDINVMLDMAKHAQQLIKGITRSTVAFYSEDIRRNILNQKLVENEMHNALQNGDFITYLQPKYRLSDEKICGAEALVRWDIGNSQIRYPDQFINVFERNGFITRLDMYMLDKSCEIISGWLRDGITPVPISVNFSRMHLANENFVDDIARVVESYNVPPKYIEIELTEGTMLGNEEVLIAFLSRLHERGFALSMDDFGSGYSSLGLLRDLPVDIIKLDKTFFAEYDDFKRAKTVISSIISMARELGICTVAEGVETVENIILLRELGCDIVQGYYYAKPMEATKLSQFMAENGAENDG